MGQNKGKSLPILQTPKSMPLSIYINDVNNDETKLPRKRIISENFCILEINNNHP